MAGRVPLVLGIDLGGTRLRLALAGRDGALLARAAADTPATSGPAAVVARMHSLALPLLASVPGTLVTVGLATPGVVDAQRGIVVAARNLTGWQPAPVAAMLAEEFGVPAVIENDVNAAATGEHIRGAGRGHDSLVFVAAGTGTGAGIIIDGRLHRGAHGAAGEIGSLPLPQELVAPGVAVLEDLASGPGILRRARAYGLAGDDLTPPAVFDAARGGHAAAQAAIRDAAMALATGLAAVIAVADPGVIVLGGGLSVQGETLLAPVRAAVQQQYALRAPLVASELGEEAQLHGAIYLAWRAARDSTGAGG